MNSWILIGGDALFLALMLQGRLAAAKQAQLAQERYSALSAIGHAISMHQVEADREQADLNLAVKRALAELPKRRSKKASKQEQSS